MNHVPKTARLKDWQKARVDALQEILDEMRRLILDGGAVVESAETLALKYAGRMLPDGKGGHRVLPLSKDGLVTKYYKWIKFGMAISALFPEYEGSNVKIPRELITELHRRCTMPGVVNTSPVINDLKREWRDGKPLPGFGTWQQWWVTKYPKLPLPPHAPEFPICDGTLYNYAPERAKRTRGNKGKASAATEMPTIRMNYGNLKPGECYIFDDVRLDLICIDDLTGYATEVKVYIAIEAGSRFIPAFVLRPATAFTSADVDELTLHTLQVMGLCQDSTTKLIYERGTLTMNPGSAKTLQRISEGRIVVIRTGMDAEVAFDGAPYEAGKGHWMGKAVIESLMHSLHLSIQTLEGQRGNNYGNQPGSLGWVGNGKKPARRTLLDVAEKLAQIDMAFDRRLQLDLGVMWLSQLRKLFREAIDLHNNDTNRDHAYVGHGKITQREVAPGVWEDCE
jgi:hypothetical protein